MLRRGSSVLGIGAMLILSGCGAHRTTAATTPARMVTTTVHIEGLPDRLIPKIQVFVDIPARGGGYLRDRQVAVGALQVPVTVQSNLTVEVAPISDGGGVQYAPVQRFQPAAHGILTFTFQKDVMITISTWAEGKFSGSMQPMGPGGHVSMAGSWVPVGTTIYPRAVPDPGWRFSHWGVFPQGQPEVPSVVSSVANPLTLTVTAPVTVAAGFVPAGP